MAAGGNPRSDGPGGDASGPVSMGDAAIRLDKWLFHARFAKSRGVAARLVSDTGVRINGARAAKSAQSVRPGDVLTFALGPHVRVVRILAPGTRRGPAPEARMLYEDLAPPPEPGERAPPPDPAAAPPPSCPTSAGSAHIGCLINKFNLKSR